MKDSWFPCLSFYFLECQPFVSIGQKDDAAIFESVLLQYVLQDMIVPRSLKRCPVIINTSRGEVIETNALLNALEDGLISDAIIDVWENEPDINLTLLNRVFLGTPHIAAATSWRRIQGSVWR